MKLSYSKTEINKIGELLKQPNLNEDAFRDVIHAINYWRKLHIEPMQKTLDMVYNCITSDSYAIAGRIKKFDTIQNKLQRLSTSKLATIYDIAGCRVVVPDLDAIEEIYSQLSKYPEYDAAKSEKRNYLIKAHPSKSGYRGRHLIFKFNNCIDDHTLFAELQIRTKLQHSWATAVELYDKAAKTHLKFGLKNNNTTNAWIFFQRSAKLIEEMENNEKIDYQKIRDQFPIQEGDKTTLKVLDTLKEASQASSVFSIEQLSDREYFIVDFLPYEQSIILSGTTSEQAIEDYYSHESMTAELDHDTVLIRGNSIEQLKILYPNYFGDISSFIKLVSKYLNIFY